MAVRNIFFRYGAGSRSFVWAVAPLVVASATTPTSHTCEFALAGWVTTRVELSEARNAHQRCVEARVTACTAEQGRVRLLEERLRLIRNYVEGYCRR